MDIRMEVIVVVVCLAFTSGVYGMQWGNPAIKVYALPGLGGHQQKEQEDQYKYATMLFKEGNPNVTITQIPTPLEYSDLGQEKCMEYISKALEEDLQNDRKPYRARVILASSQGAATIVGLMRKQQLKVPNLKGIFFEGLYLSGNDAFHHSMYGDRPEDYEPLRGVPYIRWLAPYIAQIAKLPHYSPSGAQPIHGLPHLVEYEVPFFVIHGRQDQRVSHDDALVFYTWLQQQGKKNVYLFSKQAGPHTIANRRDHVNVLTQEDVPQVHAILRKCGIFPSPDNTAKADEKILKELQPTFTPKDLEDYTKHYNAVHARHSIHVEIDQNVETAKTAAKIAAGAAAVYVAVKILSRNRARLAENAAALSQVDPEVMVLAAGVVECLVGI